MLKRATIRSLLTSHEVYVWEDERIRRVETTRDDVLNILSHHAVNDDDDDDGDDDDDDDDDTTFTESSHIMIIDQFGNTVRIVQLNEWI